MWTGNGDSGCDVTGLNWNLHVPPALQREEKGHEIPTDWTHPMFCVCGSALVQKGLFLPTPRTRYGNFTSAAIEVRLQQKTQDNSCAGLLLTQSHE